MPPILFGALSYPFTRLGYFLFPTSWANCIIAGSFTYCERPFNPLVPSSHQCVDVFYDCTHYALHHTKLPAYLREVKKYHLAHHYKNYELGFGVTSAFPTYI
jgi:4-hydroxysphinganine ceramide fatty acyl 2-hydroxylase